MLKYPINYKLYTELFPIEFKYKNGIPKWLIENNASKLLSK